MNQWIEVRNGDRVYFNGKNGEGSVVNTENHGNYFMPARIGMRIKGVKKPIAKNEAFTFSSSEVQKVNKCERTVKINLIRTFDGEEFSISEFQFMQFFVRRDESNLGGI